MLSHNLLPLIDKPTRVTNTSSTLIDHIWTNISLPIQSFVLNYDLTDHFPISVFKPLSSHVNNKLEISFCDYSERNIFLFKDQFPDMTTDFHCQSTNSSVFISQLNNFAMQAVNNYFPIRKKYIDPKKLTMPWISKELVKNIKFKQSLFKHYKAGIIEPGVYKSYCNNLKSKITLAKKNYYHAAFRQAEKNIKRTWEQINNLLGRTKTSSIAAIRDRQGDFISDKKDISNSFNKFFVNMAPELPLQTTSLPLQTTLIQYADDTSLICCHEDYDYIIRTINEDLNLFYDWACASKLSLNINKTKAMLFTPRSIPHQPNIKIQDTNLEITSRYKYLGIWLDNTLSFRSHIDHLSNRLSRLSGISYVIGDKLTLWSARSFYFTLALPVIRYLIAIWGGTCTTYIEDIQVLQNKIIKNLFKRYHPNSNTMELYHNLHILSIKQLHQHELCKLMFRAINSNCYPTLHREIHALGWSHNYNTCKINQYRAPFSSVRADANSVLVKGVNLWNSMPLSVRAADSLPSLNRELMKIFFP